MLRPNWNALAGLLLAMVGGGLLLFGLSRICVDYTGPGPRSPIAELWNILYIQVGIVISFFGLKLSRGPKGDS